MIQSLIRNMILKYQKNKLDNIDFLQSIYNRKKKPYYFTMNKYPKIKVPYHEQYETTDMKK